MHKTGTTAIQAALAASRDLLASRGFALPDTADAHHHSLLLLRHPGRSADALRAQVERARAADAHTLLLSAEGVSHQSPATLAALAEALEDVDLVYVVSVRHWSTFLPSRWAQDCRRRDSHSFRDYLREVTDPRACHVDVRHDLVLSRLAEHGAHVIALSYDNAMRTEGSILPVFLRAVGMPAETVAAVDARVTRENPSATWEQTELTRLVNGLVASRRGLPQDALVEARASGGQVGVFFDLQGGIAAGGRRVASLQGQVRGARKSLHVDVPNEEELTVRLLEEHGHRFVNLVDGRITPLASGPVDCTDLTWEAFARDNRRAMDRLLRDLGV